MLEWEGEGSKVRRIESEVKRGEGVVLIDDVEKQRLRGARAPCLNGRRQTRMGEAQPCIGARHTRCGLANRLTEYYL